MSTPNKKITDQSSDSTPSHADVGIVLPADSAVGPAADLPKRPKKAQTPYKPVLATKVKNAMEDSVQDAIEAQEIMEAMLKWLEDERSERAQIQSELDLLAPLDYRIVGLLGRLDKSLSKSLHLDNLIAKLALRITRMERRLSVTLFDSRRAKTPRKKAARNGGR